MGAEKDQPLNQRKPISRKDFLLTLIPLGIALNEGMKGLTGLSLESLFYPLLLEDVPLAPFSPAFRELYFRTGCSPEISSLKETIIGKIKRDRPASVQQLVELSLKATSPAISNEMRVRSALFALAAIGHLGPEHDEARAFFPVYIPEGKPEEKNPKRPEGALSLCGLDKSIHFASAAFFAFEILRLKNKGIIGIREADEFIIGLERAIELIGPQRISQIKASLREDPKRSFPFSPEIFGLRPEEENLATLLIDGGIAFEVLTIADYPEECLDPNLLFRRTRWIARQRLTLREENIDKLVLEALKNPKNDFVSGLNDSGVNADLAANLTGILLAIYLSRQVQKNTKELTIPSIPFDDHAARFGPWRGQVNSEGKLIAPLPQPYPQVSDYSLGLNSREEIEALVAF